MSETETVLTSSCEECNNASDPITLEEIKDIPPEFVFKVRDKTVTHCFDIRALYQYYDKCGKLENPLNRAVFSEETLDEFLKRIIQLGLTSERESETIREDRDRQERNDEDDMEIITVVRLDGRSSRNHRRRERRNQWSNVSVSSAILDAMGQGNSIARAVHRLHTDDLLQERRAPYMSQHSRPVRTHFPRQSMQKMEEPPPRQSTMQIMEAPPRPPLGSGRDYLAHSLQHESILAASRPSISGGGGSGLGRGNFTAPPALRQRPTLQTFYNGELPEEMRQFAIPQATQMPISRSQYQQLPQQQYQPPQLPQLIDQSRQPPQYQPPKPPQQQYQPPKFQQQYQSPQPRQQPPIQDRQQFRKRERAVELMSAAQVSAAQEPSGVNWVLVGLLLAVGALFLALAFPGLTSWLR